MIDLVHVPKKETAYLKRVLLKDAPNPNPILARICHDFCDF